MHVCAHTWHICAHIHSKVHSKCYKVSIEEIIITVPARSSGVWGRPLREERIPALRVVARHLGKGVLSHC